MKLQYIFLILFFASSNKINAQTKRSLDSLYKEIQFLIGDNWYLETTKKGFVVTYCKSCGKAYQQYIDSTDFFRSLTRDYFFQPQFIDSISYYETVNRLSIPSKLTNAEKNAYLANLYSANAILQFEVVFEKKWSQEHLESIQRKNDQLKDTILNQQFSKFSEQIFSDYRFWIPEDFWREYTKELGFYFERLPYSSSLLDKSIFIYHNKLQFFSAPMLVDKNDPEYFYKSENELENERKRTLKIIALSLGIQDYKILY